MKFLKYTVMAMLGLAVSLTSCSEDKYAEGAQSPGVYFADNAPAKVEIPLNGSSFDVVVYRTSVDAPSSYKLTLSDPSGLFTAPGVVNFNDDAVATTVTVSFNSADIVTDQAYPITLTVEGASIYGSESYSFTAMRANPIESESLGLGYYTYSLFWNGYSNTEVVKSWNPATPNNQTFTVDTWGAIGVSFNINVPDVTNVDADGNTLALVPCQYTGHDEGDYGQVWVADMYSYFVDVMGRPDLAGDYADSYFTPERGLFTLHLIYYIPFYGEGTSYFAEGIETLQLEGYPDYGISVEYLGTMMKPSGAYAVNAKITPNEDVAKFQTVLVAGKDPNLGIQAILGGAEGVQEFTGNAEVVAEYPVEEGGVYTVVAISFDENGEAAELAYASFELLIGAPEYEKAGVATYVDGFIAPGFGKSGIPYEVPLLKSTENANIFYLEGPYTQKGFPIYANNENSDIYRVAFDLTNPEIVLVPQQESGFVDTRNFGGMVEIGNLEAYFVAGNPDVALATIIAYLESQGYTMSTYEDGMVTINNCLFSDGGDFGYNWTSKDPGYIVMPEASSSAAAKLAAKKVTRPSYDGMLNVTARKQSIKEEDGIQRRLVQPRNATTDIKPIRFK